jgi:hypothetical protein
VDLINLNSSPKNDTETPKFPATIDEEAEDLINLDSSLKNDDETQKIPSPTVAEAREEKENVLPKPKPEEIKRSLSNVVERKTIGSKPVENRTSSSKAEEAKTSGSNEQQQRAGNSSSASNPSHNQQGASGSPSGGNGNESNKKTREEWANELLARGQKGPPRQGSQKHLLSLSPNDETNHHQQKKRDYFAAVHVGDDHPHWTVGDALAVAVIAFALQPAGGRVKPVRFVGASFLGKGKEI